VGRIRGGGVERDVTFGDAAPDAHAGIDDAYHAKYDRYATADRAWKSQQEGM
jgi:hypothetical protein